MDTLMRGERVTRTKPVPFPNGFWTAVIDTKSTSITNGRSYYLKGLGMWGEGELRSLTEQEAKNMLGHTPPFTSVDNTSNDEPQLQALGVKFQETLEELEAIPEDIVKAPSHYAKWIIQPVTFIMRNGFEFWRGNIVKYASRAGFKKYEAQDATQSEITDLKKVIRYAEMRINQLNGEQEL